VREVLLLELLVLLLVLFGLGLVSVHDAIHNLDARVQASPRVAEELGKSKLLRVRLVLLESLKLQLCALKVELGVLDVLLQLLKLQIDFGSLTEVHGPFEENLGEGKVGFWISLLSKLTLHTLQLRMGGFDKLKRAVS